MFKLENLLRNEYLPAELPPCFNSNLFADNATEISALLSNTDVKPSEPLLFSGYKNKNSRRKFAIPNPLNYAKTAQILSDHATELFAIFNINKNSLTAPVYKAPKNEECYSRKTNSIGETKIHILKQYKDNSFELRLDIQSFFDSIYTHSIAWALHSKTIAKKQRNNLDLLGNILDKNVRNMNGAQTNGILVGNAISRIISEIILCKVDQEINKTIEGINYLRYVDDYYIFVKDSSKIEFIISTIRQKLAEYSLVLNESKIQVIESPFIYGKAWVEQMRMYTDLEPCVLLEKSICEYKTYNDVAILKYALNVLSDTEFCDATWSQMQPQLLNILVKLPCLSKQITNILFANRNGISVNLLKKTLYTVIEANIVQKHDEEVFWAVWMIKTFDIKISIRMIHEILASDIWIAIIILLDAIVGRNHELSIQGEIRRFKQRMMEEHFENNGEASMSSGVWLLAYEAELKGWLNTGNTEAEIFKVIQRGTFFYKLKEMGVSFYNPENCFDQIIQKEETIRRAFSRNELKKLIKEINRSSEKQDNGEDKLTFEIYDEVVRRMRSTLLFTENY